MELRWILVLAGVGILAFLYFSGRPRKARPANRGTQPPMQHPGNIAGDPHAGNAGHYPDGYQAQQGYGQDQQNYPDAGEGYGPAAAGGQAPAGYEPGHPGMQHDHRHPPTASDLNAQDAYTAQYADQAPPHGQAADAYHTLPGSGADPLMTDARGQPVGVHGYQGDAVQDAPGVGFDIDPGDMQRPADSTAHTTAQMAAQIQPGQEPYGSAPGAYPDQSGYPNAADAGAHPAHANQAYQNPPGAANGVDSYANGVKPASGFSSFLSNLSGGLLGKDRGNGKAGGYADASGLHPNQGTESMIITLHVVAPDGQVIHGPRLQALFEQRGYHYGEMNIFHSLNQGSIVFSVAKMLEPGTFDINDPGSFETPGISLILQLPAPVASDVAFDVLVSEATEMANALGCDILDAGHSTLSRQTIQHLRDSVHQFMHRQRLAETVPS